MKIECRLSIFKTGNSCVRPSKGTVCLAKRGPTGTEYQVVFESKSSVMRLPIHATSSPHLRIIKEHVTAGKVTFMNPELTYCVSGANPTHIRRLLQDVSKILRGEQVTIDSNKPIKKHPFSGSKVSLIGNENAAQFFATGVNPNLKELALTECTLKKIRPELFASRSINSFSLINCTFEPELDGIDCFFSKFSLLNRLPLLTSLNLSGTEIPPQHICIPKTIIDVNLSNNKLLTYLPRSVYDHPTLQALDIKGCSIEVLSPKISNLKSLRLLDLSNNPLPYLPGSLASLRLDAFKADSCLFDIAYVDDENIVPERIPSTLESIAWACLRNLNRSKRYKGRNETSFLTSLKFNNWHRFISPPVLLSGETSVSDCHICGNHTPISSMVSKMKFVSPLSFSSFTDSGFVPLKYKLCIRCSEYS
ncbi:unnamed protein product [Auanema sp. JU1783]|nr:unnamed protein product [Auanema sp. JU1783]